MTWRMLSTKSCAPIDDLVQLELPPGGELARVRALVVVGAVRELAAERLELASHLACGE